jgi:putative lipoic acid-binding regulatory protein
MNTDTPLPDLISYPSLFPIKVFGLAEPDFVTFVLALIRPHYPADEEDVKINYSNEGKYISLTVMIHATSKAQLDAIYVALSAEKQRILMVL